jgi:glycogen debranching enzyme
MLRTDEIGNIAMDATGAPGLFTGDVRALSMLDLTVGDSRLQVASAMERPSSRALVLTPILGRNVAAKTIISRTQTIQPGGYTEQIEVRNLENSTLSVDVRVDLASDFADPMTLRSDRRVWERPGAERSIVVDDGSVTLGYSRTLMGAQFESSVSVHASGGPEISLLADLPEDTRGAALRWTLELAAGSSQTIELSVRSGDDHGEVPALHATVIPAASPIRQQGIEDLGALRMRCPGNPELVILAAGIPWFLTLFGRDSVVASLLAEPDLPGLLDDNIRALMATQAIAPEPARIAQPGKILHELRQSELAVLGEVPFARYYGSADSTPLFISGVAACSSAELQRDAERAVRAAVGWMRTEGGLDEHGFVRYVSDPSGLISQGWKDSFDAIAHDTGEIATGAIALCEVQGYVWRALVDAAELARVRYDDHDWAAELDALAAELQVRFRERFWINGDEFPALAIDGDGRRVEVVASNAGHLLFSGMLTPDEAARVARRLLAPDMFTGWGIRTLSSGSVRYNPLSYHNGSVWPHDTALIATGMAGYGLHDEARRVAQGLQDAGEYFGNRLPELFGGFDREEFALPVAYAHSARPQAWAAAAGLAASRLVLSGQSS